MMQASTLHTARGKAQSALRLSVVPNPQSVSNPRIDRRHARMNAFVDHSSVSMSELPEQQDVNISSAAAGVEQS
jgi:hypothetical protein